MLGVGEAPEWTRGHLEAGYRPQMDARGCLASMFRWHNQTLNAWTLAAVLVLSAAIRKRSWRGTLLFASVCAHVPFGFAYHTFLPHSPRVARALRTADYRAVFVSSAMLAGALGSARHAAAAAAVAAAAFAVDPNTLSPFAVAGSMVPSVALYVWPARHRVWIAAVLVLGAAVYLARWPESRVRRPPVNSHELMHLCLAAAHVLERLSL